MRLAAWSPHLTPERAHALDVELARSKEDLLAGSDVVSIHLVLGEGTRGLVDAAALACMRSTALLVNTSRASIVDQPALIAALQEGRIGGAGLDVFDAEPLPPDHPFRSLPNVVATPHLGYVTRANSTTFYRQAIEDIAAFLAGSPIRELA
jgi:phosphoglycerate dehydrogenase-like enzyme